jgi:hypothetical protein
VPVHDHLYISAIVEADDGDPLIPWNGRMLFGISDTVREWLPWDGDGGDDGPFGGTDDYDDVRLAQWKAFLNTQLGSNFVQELRLYDPAYQNLDVFVAQLPDPSIGPTGNRTEQLEIPFLTHWPSPATTIAGAIASGQLIDTSSSDAGVRDVAAVIDTQPGSFTIDSYVPPSGSPLSHSHYLTLDAVENPATDFSGGNFSGAGVIGAPFGSGLGNASTSIQLVFTTNTGNANDVFMELTEGTFALTTNIKKPTPDVALSPQRQVPILNPFHKTKYVIKAY